MVKAAGCACKDCDAAAWQTEIVQKITYLDGFGRAMQMVQTSGSPAGNDYVLPIEYDGLGRSLKNYLPYAGGTGGSFKTEAIAAQAGFYSGLKADGAARLL